MVADNPQTQDHILSKKDNLNKYINSALLIALVTAASYYIGYSYSSAYFSRIGIDIKSIELPTSYYIIESVIVIYFALGVLFISWPNKDVGSLSITRSIKDYSFIIILIAILIYQSISESNYYSLILWIATLVLYIIMIYKRYIFFSAWKYSNDIIWKCGVILAVIFFMTSIASFIGKQHAIVTIEGSSGSTLFIKLKTKSNISELDNKDKLIFIIHNDKKYFLTEQQKPAPLNPKIYIVHDDQVEYVVLSKSGK